MRQTRLAVIGISWLFTTMSGGIAIASEGHKLLKKSKSALAKVKVVSYRGAFKGTGWVETLVPQVNGSVLMGHPSKWDEPRYRAQVTFTTSGSTDPIEMTAGCNGDEYFLVDTKTKKVHVDMDSAVLGSGARNVQRVLFDALVSDEPFGDDLDAKTIEMRGTEDVGGVECHRVFVEGKGVPGDPMIEWLIGTKDSIPRGLRRIYNHRKDPENGEKGITELLIANLKVNPRTGKNPFDPTIPEGFTQTDEFAP